MLDDWTDGFTTYIHYVNANGGVKGQQIQLSEQNDQADPAKFSTIISSFVAQKDDFILANTLVSAYGNLYRTAAQNQIPVAVPTTVGPTVNPYIYAELPDTPDAVVTELQGAIANNLVKSPLRVATVTAGDPTIEPSIQSELAAKVSKLGGSIVAKETFGFTDTSFTVGAQKIAQAKPNIVLAAEGQQDPVWVGALRAAGVTAPIMAYSVDYNLAQLQKLNDPNFYPFYFALDPNTPGVSAFDAVKQQAQSAGTSSALAAGAIFTGAYLLAQMVVSALQKCAPNCTGAKVNAALEAEPNFNTNGMGAAQMGFSPTNHNIAASVQLFHYVNGAISPVGSQIPVDKG